MWVFNSMPLLVAVRRDAGLRSLASILQQPSLSQKIDFRIGLETLYSKSLLLCYALMLLIIMLIMYQQLCSKSIQ